MTTVVQGPFVNTQGFGTSIVLTLGGAVTSGNSLVVVATVWTSATSVSVTDNQSNVYGSADGSEVDSHNTATTYFYHLNNITNAPTSVTVSWTGGAGGYAYVLEIDESLTFDDTYVATGTSATPSLTYTTAASGSLAVGAIGTTAGHTVSSLSAGYDDILPDGAYPEFQTGFYNAATGSLGETVTLTMSGSVGYYILGAAYSAAGGGTNTTLTVDSSLLTFTPQDIPFQLTVVESGTTALQLTGSDITLTLTETTDYTLTVDSSALAFTGQDVTLTPTAVYVMTVEAGSLVFQGQSLNLVDSGNIVPAWIVGGQYGSSLFKTNYVLVVSDSGRTRWKDYIPVKQVSPLPTDINTFNQLGAVAVSILSSGTGLTEWRDYIPVVEVLDSDASRWRFDNDGWIPVIDIP